jgi:hypothetical protein
VKQVKLRGGHWWDRRGKEDIKKGEYGTLKHV